LTDLDNQAGLFFSAFQRCGTSIAGANLSFIFSGHDLERALLKMMTGLAAANGLSMQGQPLSRVLHPTIDLETLLQDPLSWIAPRGFYLVHKLGTKFQANAVVQFQPLVFRGSDTLSGLLANVQGLAFGLLAIDTPRQHTPLQNAIYRPGRLRFHLGALTHTIIMSWEDGAGHVDIDLTWQ
jgi:hypothetical protein